MAMSRCIRDLYNVDYAGASKLTKYGVTATTNTSVNAYDLAEYLNRVDLGNKNIYEVLPINGGKNNEANPSDEATLDIQCAAGLGAGNAGFYALGINNTQIWAFEDNLLTLASYLATADDAPAVISNSFGIDEEFVTQSYAVRICNDFMKACSRGVTVLCSTGDSGVGNRCDGGKFRNHFPASCSYVLAVGASYWKGTVETAARFGSGGGFSDYFTTPDYQKTDVQNYRHDHIPAAYDGKFNKDGRSYPDIALVGEQIPEVGPTKNRNNASETKIAVTGGTSASTPLLAGLLSQINDYRATLKLPTLGFINPRLYGDTKVRAAVKDITTGSNPGCNTMGLTTEKGWDPVTGLGSLDFAKLRAALST
ncbi:hypothetical protein VHEMI02442 [[Torrubiella] hemipterigena]|uniref:Peptidase S53 domain-containing protein n=1 Tax=[Torrubiella] hemipterigena TaxID=1531966 RepID=A0A0A1SPL0_9HYPO|nr:hypothetical protein VHEMI02442 [[Torrubiella] hemipterigena]